MEVYPDELNPIDRFDFNPHPYIYEDKTQTSAYKAKLAKEQLPLFHHPVGTYWKDELPYYGPKITYNHIPDPLEDESSYLVIINLIY